MDHAPFPTFNFADHCEEIHVDAGSQLISGPFEDWCRDHRVKLVIAGVAHQEMNGLVERMWQANRKIAFSLCAHARLGWPFLHKALHCGAEIMDALPIKGCVVNEDGIEKQLCPAKMWFVNRPSTEVQKCRAFGSPCVAKVHSRETPKVAGKTQQSLNSKNAIQRGVRGIFVGFPKNQAGWSVFIPQSGKILNSADVAFDESFSSVALAFD